MSEDIEKLLRELTSQVEEESELEGTSYAIVLLVNGGVKVKLKGWKNFRPRTADLIKRKIIQERDRMRSLTIKGKIPEED